jgi:hypothetical protein
MKMVMRSVACVVLLACCSGCSDGNPFDYIPVSGRLTYEDGTPIPASGIRLGFSVQGVEPKDGAYPPPGEAIVDAEGNFSKATTYRPGDGLIPGQHKVAIHYATDAKGKLLIPKEYAHPTTSPLVVDTAQLPLEIKVPRP